MSEKLNFNPPEFKNSFDRLIFKELKKAGARSMESFERDPWKLCCPRCNYKLYDDELLTIKNKNIYQSHSSSSVPSKETIVEASQSPSSFGNQGKI